MGHVKIKFRDVKIRSKFDDAAEPAETKSDLEWALYNCLRGTGICRPLELLAEVVISFGEDEVDIDTAINHASDQFCDAALKLTKAWKQHDEQLIPKNFIDPPPQF